MGKNIRFGALFNLNKKFDRIEKQDQKQQKSKKKTWLLRIAALFVILFVAVYLPSRSIYLSSKQAVSSSKAMLAGAKQEDLDAISSNIVEARKSVQSIEQSLNWFFWVGLIPFVGGYYNDAKHLVKAANYELEAAQIAIDALEPHKQELGLVGQPIPGQDRFAQSIKVLDKLLPNLDKIEPSLKKARTEVEKIDTGKYPAKFGTQLVRSRIEGLQSMIIGADIVVADNRDLIEQSPDALGYKSPKTYLLLFQNDKELRPTGGFLTAYATLTFDKGNLSTSGSDDIYRLDERLLKVCERKICPLAPPEPIVKYLPEEDGEPRTAWAIRDSNLSPDLPTALGEFERMYKLLGEGLPFDGIVMIDTEVVEGIINVTGPVDIFGTVYSAELDSRCDCPNVIYELEHYANIVAKGETDRKAVLGTLMQQILAKSLGAGPDKLPTFIDVGVKLANDKHIMFYMHDQRLQQSLSRLNWTGEIKQVAGDYLHINDANFAGGKSNLYVDQKVMQDIAVDKEGNVTLKLSIEYKNPRPFNIWLNGILRSYVRIYVPKGSTLVSTKGSDDPVQTKQDTQLDKTYFEGFVTVRPQNSRVLEFEYKLPFKVSGHDYPLLVQKQPGAKDHHYTIKINGKNKAEFNLISDNSFKFNF